MCWCLGLHAHILDIMSLAIPCLDLHVCMHVLFSYAYVYAFIVCMLGFVFFHAFMLTSTCLDVHSHAYMHISMLICVDQCVYMLGSMFSKCFTPSSMCLCASHHVYVLRPRPCLLCHMLLLPFCSFYRIFLCFGLMVRTRSRPYGVCHRPYTTAHIKRVWIIPICMSMLACLYILCLC